MDRYSYWGSRGKDHHTQRVIERNASTLERQTKQAQKTIQSSCQENCSSPCSQTKNNKAKPRCRQKTRTGFEDEEWLLKCIEGKATINGRQHESVLYTHHRVKTRDLLNIANYHRYKQGKRLLKSVSSVTTRARPTNKRSQQAKRHIGKGLWCSKKPPRRKTTEASARITNRNT